MDKCERQANTDFRDNPKLGDGNYIVGHNIINYDIHFRDNPKLGDGNKSLSMFQRRYAFISEITPN